MQLSLLVAALASASTAMGMALSPRQSTNTCFDGNTGQCLTQNADKTKALAAITAACEKVPTCTPGQTNTGRQTVTGKVSGFPYTATLFVGDQCAGVTNWSTDACVDLFNVYVNERCQASAPAPDAFVLGYVRAPCDTSFVSFNFGG